MESEMTELWNDLPEEAKHTYGENYIQGFLKLIEVGFYIVYCT